MCTNKDGLNGRLYSYIEHLKLRMLMTIMSLDQTPG